MLLRYSLFILITLAATETKAQILLNADAAAIRKQIVSEGGRLTKTFDGKDEKHRYYRKMFFRFATPPQGNSALMDKIFYLTDKNKCYKYDETYWGRDMVDETIVKFNNPAYGLKRIKNTLKWVSLDRKYEAYIDSESMDNGKIFSVYILKVKINNPIVR